MTERLLTAAELADTLEIAAGTVLEWFGAGRLPGFKLGRASDFIRDRCGVQSRR